MFKIRSGGGFFAGKSTAKRAFGDHVGKVARCGGGWGACNRHVVLRAKPTFKTVDAFGEDAQQGLLLGRVQLPCEPVEEAGLGQHEFDLLQASVLRFERNVCKPAEPEVRVQG